MAKVQVSAGSDKEDQSIGWFILAPPNFFTGNRYCRQYRRKPPPPTV